jgi:hypothetical protein
MLFYVQHKLRVALVVRQRFAQHTKSGVYKARGANSSYSYMSSCSSSGSSTTGSITAVILVVLVFVSDSHTSHALCKVYINNPAAMLLKHTSRATSFTWVI